MWQKTKENLENVQNLWTKWWYLETVLSMVIVSFAVQCIMEVSKMQFSQGFFTKRLGYYTNYWCHYTLRSDGNQIHFILQQLHFVKELRHNHIEMLII